MITDQLRQAFDVSQSQLQQTEEHDDAVKDVPAHLKPWQRKTKLNTGRAEGYLQRAANKQTQSDLKVAVGVHGDKFKDHLSCEDGCEDL